MGKLNKKIWTIIISEHKDSFVIKSTGSDEKEALVNYITELFRDSEHKEVITKACNSNSIDYVKSLILRNKNIEDIRCVEGDPKEHFSKLEEYRTHRNRPRKIRMIIIGILWTLIGILSIMYFAL